MKNFFKSILSEGVLNCLRGVNARLKQLDQATGTLLAKLFLPFKLFISRKKSNRKLEIGPGDYRIPGFETLNVVSGKDVDFVCDASGKLPFKDATFELVYTSHILEHVPWFLLEASLREWSRIIKPGGSLEVFVPNGLKICQAFVDAETKGANDFQQDNWYKFNDEKDPCVWANGRIFSYGDGNANKMSPNWHLALFSERYLRLLLEKVGFTSVELLSSKDVRGHDHGWINMGLRARK